MKGRLLLYFYAFISLWEDPDHFILFQALPNTRLAHHKIKGEIFSSSNSTERFSYMMMQLIQECIQFIKKIFWSKARVLLSHMNRSQTNKESIFSIIWQFFFLVAIGKDALVVHLGRFLSQVFFLYFDPLCIFILIQSEFYSKKIFFIGVSWSHLLMIT